MFGIILVTHGDMAAGILDSAKMILDQPDDLSKTGVEIVALKEGESPETLLEQLGGKIEKMRTIGFEGVLILADLFGSSTTTVATRILLTKADKEKTVPIEVISGLNLPMLIELIPMLDKSRSIEELAKLAVEVGRKGIISIVDKIARRSKK